MADSNNKYYGNFIPLTGDYEKKDVRLIGSTGMDIDDISTADEYKFRFRTSEVPFAQLTTTQRDAVFSPAEGYTIYNLTTHKLEVFDGTIWRQAW